MFIFDKPKYASLEYFSIFAIPLTAFLVYFTIIIIGYNYYSDSLVSRKNDILNDYYKIILNHNLVKLDYLLQKSAMDKIGVNTTINIDKSDVKICDKQKCININLFELASTIDKHIPNFVYYKVEINKITLHYNNKIPNYELDKTYSINDYNQISIGVSIDINYWNKIKKQVAQPLIYTILLSSLFLALLILSNKLLSKYIRKHYYSYYKNHYDLELKKIEVEYQDTLIAKENLLMKKIWDLEFHRAKDVEFNYLFSMEANKLAMIIKKTAHLNMDINQNTAHTLPSLPCSIILYYTKDEQEKINIRSLIEIFSNRFAESEDNISVLITSSEKNLQFVSKASLYQIIYSIISYIIFIIKEQSCNHKHNIKLNIQSNKENISFVFEYDGFPLSSEEDVLRLSNKFFEKHANPFLLSLNQIFNILRNNNFDCNVSYTHCNLIEITKNISEKYFNNTKSNIIQLPIKYE